jgi:hypothetical protein
MVGHRWVTVWLEGYLAPAAQSRQCRVKALHVFIIYILTTPYNIYDTISDSGQCGPFLSFVHPESPFHSVAGIVSLVLDPVKQQFMGSEFQPVGIEDRVSSSFKISIVQRNPDGQNTQ